MTRNITRVGRRRRVLNDEFLSASNLAARSNSPCDTMEPGDTPRYGAGANIENHPQVTSFVPRRLRTLFLVACTGLGVGALAELASHYAGPLSELVEVVSADEITAVFANRLVAWTSATLLLAIAAYTRLIFSLRRHRVDDYRGLYRVWRTAGWTAAALSLNAVLGAHELIARSLGHLANYQLLPGSVGWWLGPAAVLGGWLLIKLIIDASECRTAMAAYLAAIACLTVGAIHSAGWSPAWAAAWPDMLSRAMPLCGFTLLLLGSQVFARFVVLDVQGLIEHRAADVLTASMSEEAAEEAAEESPQEVAVEPVSGPAAELPSSAWVDGRECEANDDGPIDRYLSKAERKRLRKQKQRRAA